MEISESTTAGAQIGVVPEHTAHRFRLGADIGGTFTDVVLIGTDGSIATKKVLVDARRLWTRHRRRRRRADRGARCRPTRSLASCTRRRSRPTPSSREGRAHRRSSPPRASATCSRCGACGSPCSTTCSTKPPPLVPRRLRLEVDERMGPRGEVGRRFDEESVASRPRQIRDAGVESVAISLLHAYADAGTSAASRRSCASPSATTST